MRCGASNAHRGDRRFDPHVAGLRNLAGNKNERPPGQIEDRRIGFPGWVVDIFVQRHAGVARQIERSSIDKVDADPSVGTGSDHIAQIDGISDLRLDGFARDVYLDNGGTRMLDDDRAVGRHNFPDWL